MDDIIIGTGFLLGQGDEIWSCQHVFIDYLDGWAQALREAEPNLTPAQVAERVAKLAVPMMFFDQNGKKLTISGEKHFTAITYRPDQSLIGAPGFIDSFRTDFAAVHLPKKIGTPLQLASERTAIGEKSYILGFPVRTVDRQISYGVPDSTGQDKLHVSLGPQVSLSESLQRLGVMNSAIRGIAARLTANPTERQAWEQGMDFLWADAEHGNSGGPVLNAHGEVTGIVADIQREYRGVNPSLNVTLAIHLPRR
jgi:hypothetical protein